MPPIARNHSDSNSPPSTPEPHENAIISTFTISTRATDPPPSYPATQRKQSAAGDVSSSPNVSIIVGCIAGVALLMGAMYVWILRARQRRRRGRKKRKEKREKKKERKEKGEKKERKEKKEKLKRKSVRRRRGKKGGSVKGSVKSSQGGASPSPAPAPAPEPEAAAAAEPAPAPDAAA